jgi:molybdate transport system substrate-binding protein
MRLLASLLLLIATPLWAGESLRVAVAANFKPTLEQASREFEAKTGIGVKLSSASSGVLASQVRLGAPFDLFFAADRAGPEELQDRAAKNTGGAFCYAIGRLALAGGRIEDLDNGLLSLAIANPVTAPYGRAAMEVLRHRGETGQERTLVRGNNVAQAYQFWHSGAVDMALLPQAMAPPGAPLIPAHWHKPIAQYALALSDSPDTARYLKWMRSDRVRSLILDAGYEPCP